jgi:hypothetical protein
MTALKNPPSLRAAAALVSAQSRVRDALLPQQLTQPSSHGKAREARDGASAAGAAAGRTH